MPEYIVVLDSQVPTWVQNIPSDIKQYIHVICSQNANEIFNFIVNKRIEVYNFTDRNIVKDRVTRFSDTEELTKISKRMDTFEEKLDNIYKLLNKNNYN